jgi:hypothetical protein
VSLGRVCLAHPDHADAAPIVFHHVRPVSRGGAGTMTVQLCANAHGLVHALLDDIEAVALTSPYATVDEVIRLIPRGTWAFYPGAVRVIAYKGWQSYGLGFLGGRYQRQHQLWDTTGAARNANTPAYADVRHAARWSRRWRREIERL